MTPSIRTIVLGSSLVALASALAWFTSGDPREPELAVRKQISGPNVLIVVVDSMRADHLTCYGYDRETAPAIDALSRDPDSVVFRRHYAQAGYTQASTASLFSGLYGFQHGVIRGPLLHRVRARPRFFFMQQLDDQIDTMAERFRRIGYRTFGVVKALQIGEKAGFAQGFDEYHGPSEIGGDESRARATLALASAPGPFFGYVHLAGSHHPFPPKQRHSGFMQRYGDPAATDYDEAARIEAGVDFTTPETQDAINEGRLTLEPEDVEFLNLVYDAELRLTDDNVGAIIEGLAADSLYDNTLLIISADHGEELYDHDGYGHGHALWDEVIRVPLIVKFPRGRKPDALPRQVTRTTRAIDLMPALLDFVGDDPSDPLPGSRIFSARPADFAYSETSDRLTFVQGSYKLIDDRRSPLLFDISTDPGEQLDLAAQNPARVRAMRNAFARLMRDYAGIGPGDAPVIETQYSDEVIEAMQRRGYFR